MQNNPFIKWFWVTTLCQALLWEVAVTKTVMNLSFHDVIMLMERQTENKYTW